MRRYLLDTNVISEMRRRKPHGAVVAWLSALRDEQTLVSAVTLGELQSGVERAREQDAEKAAEIEKWVEQVQDTVQVVPMDAISFREWGKLMHGKSDQLTFDAMIAATAKVHSLTVATRDETDFRQLGVEIINPFKFIA